MDHGDAQRHGLAGGDLLPKNHRQVVEEGRRRKNGVPGHVGPGTVAPLALKGSGGDGGTRHPGAGVHTHLIFRQVGIDVNAPAAVHMILLQRCQQSVNAGALLLPFLKAEENGAAELILQLGQDLQCPQQHGHMSVMAAGVAVAVMLRFTGPGPGQVLIGFLHGKAVDVGPKGHHLTGAAGVQLDDDTVGGDLLIGKS